MPEKKLISQHHELTIASWNILLDYTRSEYVPSHKKYIQPQKQRIGSHIAKLQELPFQPDVVCLQEVQGKRDGKEGTNGEIIAMQVVDDTGFWFNHNTSKRKGEYIGMFGKQVLSAEAVETRHDKVGVLTKVGNVAIMGVHNRFELIGPMRTHQTADILEHLANEEHAVIMGDFNAVGWEKPHRLIKDAGFVSVFKKLDDAEPKTHPTDAYRDIFYDPLRKSLLPNGTASDRIYVRNCDVIAADTFASDASDHAGVWATIRPV